MDIGDPGDVRKNECEVARQAMTNGNFISVAKMAEHDNWATLALTH